MKPRLNHITSASLLLAGLFLAGCNLAQPQADNQRHFILSGPAAQVPAANSTKVRPVHVAGHLHGRSMAVRVSEHEVVYLEDFRWAEPIDESITQLLRNRLAVVGSGATVSVQIDRCELVRNAGNSVQLVASYSILLPDADKNSPQRGVFISAPRTWDRKDYGTLVGLLGDAVGELGDAIAAILPEKK